MAIRTRTRVPLLVQYVAVAAYLGYWLIVAGHLPALGVAATIIVWVVSSTVLTGIAGRRLGPIVALATAAFIALGAATWGNGTSRLPDATSAALYAYAQNFEPDAGPVARCSGAVKYEFPARFVYSCQAGYCKSRNHPVYVVRVTVTHSVFPGRWTYSRSGGVGPAGRVPPVHGGVDPGSVNPVNCSALGPGRGPVR